MTRLRKMMLEELERRNYSKGTIRNYLRFVERFARHFGKSPDKLGPEHLRSYQAYLFKERKLCAGSVEHHVAALRFFFLRVLHRHEFRQFLPYPKVRRKLPNILSREEVARLIEASSSLFERTLLMVLYGTGMRRAEIQRQFDAIIDFAGVEQFLDTPVKRYSSGMYVRLAFAVAAHLNPEILIVDEVLAVGDSEFQKKCLGKLCISVSLVLFAGHFQALIGGKYCSVFIGSHIRDLHFLEDGELADLHHVLHLDALDRLALGVEAVDAQKGPVLLADPKTDGGEPAVVVRAGLGFKNVGVEGLDRVGAERLDIVPVDEIEAHVLVVDVGVENRLRAIGSGHRGPRCA